MSLPYARNLVGRTRKGRRRLRVSLVKVRRKPLFKGSTSHPFHSTNPFAALQRQERRSTVKAIIIIVAGPYHRCTCRIRRRRSKFGTRPGYRRRLRAGPASVGPVNHLPSISWLWEVRARERQPLSVYFWRRPTYHPRPLWINGPQWRAF
jgi:hypothetical protein